MLRCALLVTYGGVWIDATIFLTGSLPEEYFKSGFFMFQRDDKEIHKTDWESSFAYYWGWYEGFRVRVLTSLLYASKGNEVITDLCNILYAYWLENNSLSTYFFFQILFNELVTKKPSCNCPIVSDCIPHYAMQILTNNFLQLSFQDVVKLSNIHKVSYKLPGIYVEALKEKLKEIGEL